MSRDRKYTVWTEADDAICDAVLADAGNVDDAVADCARKTGIAITRHTLDGRLKRRGLGSTYACLGRKRLDPVDVSGLDLDDDPTSPGFTAHDTAPASIADLDEPDVVTSAPPVDTPAPVAQRRPRVEAVTEAAPAPPPADRTYVEKPPSQRDFEPLDLGSRTVERVLLIPDTHAPYHDPRAWDAMMKFARGYQPDTVVHVGDWLDAFTVSDHDKDPRRGSQFEDELKSTRELRAEVDALGAQRKVFCAGNHEDRATRFAMRHAPALMSMLQIDGLLELPQHGWSCIPYRQHATLGHLNLTHEAGFAGVYAVQHTGNAFAASVAFGHTHRLGMSYFGDTRGKRHVSASLGWLGSMPAASYEHEAKRMRYWQHGFGTTSLLRDGTFSLELIPIVDYRIIRTNEVLAA